jgi:hypothetical protein
VSHDTCTEHLSCRSRFCLLFIEQLKRLSAVRTGATFWLVLQCESTSCVHFRALISTVISAIIGRSSSRHVSQILLQITAVIDVDPCVHAQAGASHVRNARHVISSSIRITSHTTQINICYNTLCQLHQVSPCCTLRTAAGQLPTACRQHRRVGPCR